MLTGLTGSLLSHYFAERLLQAEFTGRLGEASFAEARRRLLRWKRELASQLGPASSVRAVMDLAAAPLMEILGFVVHRGEPLGDGLHRVLLTCGEARLALVAGHWSDSPDRLWRRTVRTGIDFDTDWCLCTNGRELRLVDSRRTYARAFLQFDLAPAIEGMRTCEILWGLMRGQAFPGLIDQIIKSSSRHGQAVGDSLRSGVVQALEQLLSGLLNARLRHRRAPREEELAAGFEESLTIVYRVLFLMFAEARALVPIWHPIYRENYTIESLRDEIEKTKVIPGVWEALQAIARLAHRGCRAGTLDRTRFQRASLFAIAFTDGRVVCDR